METLMKSLLGKDEQHIVSTLQSLVNDGENFKAQKEIVKKLECELEESKEEIHYLENRLNQKRNVIDDIEHDLEMSERENEEAKKVIDSKVKELDDMGKFIAKQGEEMAILQDNNQSMVSQIAENIRMEKKLEIQDKLIKELKAELKERDRKSFNTNEDMEKLQNEIEELQVTNKEKVKLLKSMSDDYEKIRDKLEDLESENAKPLECTLCGENLPMANQLKDHVERFHVSLFVCDSCGEMFPTENNLKDHLETVHAANAVKAQLKEKLANLENEFFHLKSKVSIKLLQLKEKEYEEKQTCRCQGWCGISHIKHNWRKSSCDSIFAKFNAILTN